MKNTLILRAAVGLALSLTALPANRPKQWAQDVLPVAGSVYRQLTLTTPGAQAGHWHVTVTPAFETSAAQADRPTTRQSRLPAGGGAEEDSAVRTFPISCCVETEFRGLSRYQTGVW